MMSKSEVNFRMMVLTAPWRLLTDRIKLEDMDCLLLRMKCETALFLGFQGFACTISFLLPVLQQKPLYRLKYRAIISFTPL